jgi:ATP-dependent DNA ligase
VALGWIHGVRLITRNGHDFGARFPAVAASVSTLAARSCVIDGEAIVCDEAWPFRLAGSLSDLA